MQWDAGAADAVLATLTALIYDRSALIILMSLSCSGCSTASTRRCESLIGSFIGPAEDLPNALALNAMLFNAGRFVGRRWRTAAGAHVRSGVLSDQRLLFLALIVGLLLIEGHRAAAGYRFDGQVFREGDPPGAPGNPHADRHLIALNLTGVGVRGTAAGVSPGTCSRVATTLSAGCGGRCGAFAYRGTAGVARVSARCWRVIISAASVIETMEHRIAPVDAAMAGTGFGISVCNGHQHAMMQGMAPENCGAGVVSFFIGALRFRCPGGPAGRFHRRGDRAGHTPAGRGRPAAAFVAFCSAQPTARQPGGGKPGRVIRTHVLHLGAVYLQACMNFGATMRYGEFDTASLMYITNRPDLVFRARRGAWLYDHNGKRYLDFIQGWAVNCLGHCPAEITDALVKQAKTLLNPSPAFYNGPMVEPPACSPPTRCSTACSSPTPAPRPTKARSLARKWGNCTATAPTEIITFDHSFHGRTLANHVRLGQGRLGRDVRAAGAGLPEGRPQRHRLGRGPHHRQDRRRDAGAGAGRGGVIPGRSPEFMQALRKLTRERGILLIVDEVQAGMGRTGTLFAYRAVRASSRTS